MFTPNISLNVTLYPRSPGMLWPYLSVGLLVIGLLLTILGDGAVLVAIYRRTSRTLTADFLTELLFCDILLAILLFPATAAPIISQRWMFGDVYCSIQGFLINIITTVSYLLRMMLALESLSYAVKKRGMKISTGTARAFSALFICTGILHNAFLQKQGNHYMYVDGLYSCRMTNDTLSGVAFTVMAMLLCMFILSVSMWSFTKWPICKSGVVSPSKIPSSVNVPSMPMFVNPESTPPAPTDLSLLPRSNMYRHQDESSTGRTSDAKETSRRPVYPAFVPRLLQWTNPGSSVMPATAPPLSNLEAETTEALAVLNIVISSVLLIRLGFFAAVYIYPGTLIFQSIPLACYIIPCAIQPVILFCKSSALRIAILGMMWSHGNVIEKKSRPISQPNDGFPPQDNNMDFPTYFREAPPLSIHLSLNRQGKPNSDVNKKCGYDSMISSIVLKIDAEGRSIRQDSASSIINGTIDSLFLFPVTSEAQSKLGYFPTSDMSGSDTTLPVNRRRSCTLPVQPSGILTEDPSCPRYTCTTNRTVHVGPTQRYPDGRSILPTLYMHNE